LYPDKKQKYGIHPYHANYIALFIQDHSFDLEYADPGYQGNRQIPIPHIGRLARKAFDALPFFGRYSRTK
jgi:hypothetical protein